MMDPLPRRRKSPGREEADLPAYRLIPISEESLQAICDVSTKVVGKQHSASFNRYIQALWLSGCRMREPLMIHSRRKDCHRPIRLDGTEPKFFWTPDQKSKRAGAHRITLDFANDVKEHMDSDRFLYRPTCETGEILSRHSLGRLIAKVCEQAEVFAEEGRYATAKHFRTSFVQRWSARGMPIRLIQDMCRHTTEATTRKYYVGDADAPIEFDETAYDRA